MRQILLPTLFATAATAAVSFALRPPAAPPAPASPLASELAALQQQHTELARAFAELAAARPAVAAAPVREAAPTLAPEAVAAAVEAYLAARPGGATPAEASANVPTFDFDRDFGKLAKADFWADATLWRAAFAAGRMDEVIARYDALAKADPKNVQAKMDLAKACIAYLQMDPTKWQLSSRADKAYDDVLAIDGTHWEARFSKAVSYTFWPEFLGKKKAAAEHFQILVDQQEQQPVADHQAQTYLYLGNLLEAREPERAKEVWRRGLTRHPQNAALREKLGQ